MLRNGGCYNENFVVIFSVYDSVWRQDQVRWQLCVKTDGCHDDNSQVSVNTITATVHVLAVLNGLNKWQVSDKIIKQERFSEQCCGTSNINSGTRTLSCELLNNINLRI